MGVAKAHECCAEGSMHARDPKLMITWRISSISAAPSSMSNFITTKSPGLYKSLAGINGHY